MKGRYVVRARARFESQAAASTTAREWVEQHGGRAVVLERGLFGIRVLLERYPALRPWWWVR